MIGLIRRQLKKLKGRVFGTGREPFSAEQAAALVETAEELLEKPLTDHKLRRLVASFLRNPERSSYERAI